MERKWNANGTRMERKWNANRTHLGTRFGRVRDAFRTRFLSEQYCKILPHFTPHIYHAVKCFQRTSTILSSRRSLRSPWPINFYCIRKMTVTVFTKKIQTINSEGDKNRMVCGATKSTPYKSYNRRPINMALSLSWIALL
jgi:hypothetical protein